MNLCVVSEYSCTFEDFKEMVDKTTGETDAFLTEMELIKVHDHKSVLLLHCTEHQPGKLQVFTLKVVDIRSGPLENIASDSVCRCCE